MMGSSDAPSLPRANGTSNERFVLTFELQGAMAKLQHAMVQFNTSRFWGQHYDWCVGDHCDQPASGFNGADVIANSAMILYGAAHSLFGFRTDLRGVHIYGRPAKALKEGAKHRFIHLGKQIELRVVCRPTCKTTITDLQIDKKTQPRT
jgi:hypothetical protein